MYTRWFIIILKRNYLIFFFCLFTALTFLSYVLIIAKDFQSLGILGPNVRTTTLPTNIVVVTKPYNDNEIVGINDLYRNSELRYKILEQKVERLTRNFKKSRSIIVNSKNLRPSYHVHIFYYAWYRSKEFDGAYKHWNHRYLPNWRNQPDNKVNPTGAHQPPLDIGSNYYPQLGCYSSCDPKVIETHMKWIRDAGVGVVVVSWMPPKHEDSPSDILPLLFEYAERYELKIAPHVEPYVDRNPIHMIDQLKIFFQKYAHHPAMLKLKKPLSDVEVPVVYIYDSYLIPAVAWKELLNVKGNLSVRGTIADAIYLGLLVDLQHRYHVKKSSFDGFYTYFATNGFTYGSTWKNWRGLSKFATRNGLVFVPSVGPGYVDTQVRPWNTANARHRRQGQYYDFAWRTAINSDANFVSVTSFNEWHEGTQIEPAVPMKGTDFAYLNYGAEGPSFYLNLTKWWVNQFNKTR